MKQSTEKRNSEKKNALRELGNFVALALTKSQFNI